MKFELGERCFHFSLLAVKEAEYMRQKKVPFSVIDQFIRSSTSVGGNVIEGQSNGSTKELIRYYRIALKSANETKYWLRLIREGFEVAENKQIELACNEIEQLSKIIASIIIKLNKKIEV